MPRQRKRVRLEDGLKLDLSKLIHEGLWPPGNDPMPIKTQWTFMQEVIASALITIQKEGEHRGFLRIVVVGKLEQRLDLISQPRHFGGRQWYFRCPVTALKEYRTSGLLWI